MARRVLIGFAAVVGALATLLIATLAALAVRQYQRYTRPTPGGLQYVLNWADLGTRSRILAVLNTCVDSPIVGDYVRAYSLKIDGFPEAIVGSGLQSTWVKGPVADPLLVEAIATAASFPRHMGCDWFPAADLLNSDRFYLSFFEVTAFHGRTESVKLTAYDRAAQLLYHSEVSW
jgi:hypothetical protein